MAQALLLTLIGAIIGMVVLAISVISRRPTRAWFHLPLAGLLVAIAVLMVPPLAQAVLPTYATNSIAAGLPALLMLGPLFWMYVRALTSEEEWRWTNRELLHLLPALAGLCVAAAFQTLPLQAREAMVLRGEMPLGTAPAVIGTLAWLLILFWLPQSLYYLIRSGKQLLRYRAQLKQMFANTEQREMQWLMFIMALLASVWLVVIVAASTSNILNYSIINRVELTSLALIAVWVLCVWGLSQRPGFHGHYLAEPAGGEEADSEEAPPASVPVVAAKYSRSALDPAQSTRIASKIEHAMATQKLYLEPDLTLGTLAKVVGAQPNYVSQTLNETLGETFFDYVNKKRVEAAQTILRETDQTALDIAYAVGFNARSSFYKAFQRWAGVSPGEYRKAAARRSGQGPG